ncbi:hypothetical protein GCQ56_14820 [Marinifilum sp. N1E240]|uniref:DUF5694 domain-containing protein n=1 Tax=Marinifilum sp. N1E240 TaxID=2608082 RepID=UPI00128CDB2F|nr:DUF5694 domain-containing protein [Marinifilum sp. N1E240]MPQ48274.1 hypothetical protein [Marinifilum sp. N1E240]
MRIYITILLISIYGITFGQVNGFSDPDSLLVTNKLSPKVLLVGSWHFSYPGLDAHQIEENNRINIYSEKRQKELKVLLEYIALFKPTKILVESKNTSVSRFIKNYKDWKEGKQQLYANEISQIGLRLADQFELDTIYGVDTWSFLEDHFLSRDTLKPKTYIDSIYDRHYFGGQDDMSIKYSKFYAYKNKMTVEKPLLESFLYFNSEKVLDRGFGAYIAGGQFESSNFEGADALSMFWFNRNLRIFKNIKDIGYNQDDRILVIFGAGHVSILRYLFKCSPEFELTDFDKLK